MMGISRRAALGLLGAGGAGLPAAQQQPSLAGEPAGRIPPVAELINTLEVEAMARRKLDSLTFATIADSGGGADRAAFDRMTFRPRLMVNTMGLDLTTEIFGQRHFAPILAGPAADLQRLHPEGAAAMASGAKAAKASLIVSARSGAEAAGNWVQFFPEPDARALRGKMDEAVRAGAQAIVLTLGLGDGAAGADWASIDQLCKGLGAPFLLKGIMSPAEARSAVERGVQGIVVSNYRGERAAGLASTIEVLPAIVEAVAGRAPVLIDGGFRRGSDVVKAIALGARAVVVTRPVLWGLAAYGAPGVQHALELLQTELGRAMAMCGKANIAAVDKSLVRLHRR